MERAWQHWRHRAQGSKSNSGRGTWRPTAWSQAQWRGKQQPSRSKGPDHGASTNAAWLQAALRHTVDELQDETNQAARLVATHEAKLKEQCLLLTKLQERQAAALRRSAELAEKWEALKSGSRREVATAERQGSPPPSTEAIPAQPSLAPAAGKAPCASTVDEDVPPKALPASQPCSIGVATDCRTAVMSPARATAVAAATQAASAFIPGVAYLPPSRPDPRSALLMPLEQQHAEAPLQYPPGLVPMSYHAPIEHNPWPQPWIHPQVALPSRTAVPPNFPLWYGPTVPEHHLQTAVQSYHEEAAFQPPTGSLVDQEFLFAGGACNNPWQDVVGCGRGVRGGESGAGVVAADFRSLTFTLVPGDVWEELKSEAPPHPYDEEEAALQKFLLYSA